MPRRGPVNPESSTMNVVCAHTEASSTRPVLVGVTVVTIGSSFSHDQITHAKISNISFFIVGNIEFFCKDTTFLRNRMFFKVFYRGKRNGIWGMRYVTRVREKMIPRDTRKIP